MKMIANLIRVVTGILFVFSGFIKLNDPVGFSLKLDEYFNVFNADLSPKPATLLLDIQCIGPKENFAIVLRRDSIKKIKVVTDKWQHIEQSDGSNKSFYDLTTIKVSVDGQNLFQRELRKNDAKPFELKLDARIDKNSCIHKTFTIYNNQDINFDHELYIKPYIKQDPWLKWVIQVLFPYTLLMAILFCVFELALGMALLIGYKPGLVLGLMSFLLIFFTFLTWYSAYYNKVTDCGCFGNAIPLSPWQSFIKDSVLCFFVLILIGFRSVIKPIFSPKFSVKLLAVIASLSIAFACYTWYYLPVFNFLKFAVGNDIEKMTQLAPDAIQEKREMMFIYTKGGKDFEFSTQQVLDEKLAENTSYQFKDRIDKVIVVGDKAEIRDFKLEDADGTDHLSDFFAKNEYKLVLISENLAQTRPRAMKKIAALATKWSNHTKFEFWALTSSTPQEAEATRHEYQLPFKFYYGDNTNLKSIIRSNPGLILLKKGTIIATWPSTDLPSFKELERKIK